MKKKNARRRGKGDEKNGEREKGKGWRKYAEEHFCLLPLFFKKWIAIVVVRI